MICQPRAAAQKRASSSASVASMTREATGSPRACG